MTLKYYTEEFNRYGSLGPITETKALQVIDITCSAFNLPRVKLKISKKAKRFSWYRPGLHTVAPNGAISPALGIPVIQLADTMMNYRTVLHELAHHMHYTEHDRFVKALAANSGIKTDSSVTSRVELYNWVRFNIKKEHAHGHKHRVLMQKLVDYFRGTGEITVLPNYLNLQVVADRMKGLVQGHEVNLDEPIVGEVELSEQGEVC